LYYSFYYFQKQYLKKVVLKKIYEANLFYPHIITALTIGVLSINSEITFAQEKNETSEIDDSGLITTTEIDESMETNNTSAQMTNNTSIIK
jgi:hypothetical protein